VPLPAQHGTDRLNGPVIPHPQFFSPRYKWLKRIQFFLARLANRVTVFSRGGVPGKPTSVAIFQFPEIVRRMLMPEIHAQKYA
jgi:hypothetical protein